MLSDILLFGTILYAVAYLHTLYTETYQLNQILNLMDSEFHLLMFQENLVLNYEVRSFLLIPYTKWTVCSPEYYYSDMANFISCREMLHLLGSWKRKEMTLSYIAKRCEAIGM